MPTVVKTLKLRVKDKHAPLLLQMAQQVNFVWNFVNDLSSRSIRERGKWLSAYDIHPYTKGAAKELGLHSHTLQCVAQEYVTRRRQCKRTRLNWRKSTGSQRSLGWIPINTGAASWKSGQVYHNGHYFGVWDSYGLGQYRFKTASFNEDARGRWYFNVAVEIETKPTEATASVGIDLGLKDCATTSTGQKLHGRWYRELEPQLAIAQRARKKQRVRAIHAKIANRRKDEIHKFTTELVKNNAAIFVGDVASAKLVKTRMAKSTLDAGWSSLKTALEYKCHQAGVVFEEVNEAYSTQTCSACGALPQSRPKGIAGLGIREWTCSECGAAHERDVNAARNILAAGHCRLAGGITAL
ncbi:transposase, IS605 OrfB family, central region [Lampropedia hyalina DSM 16112]|jgi:IS605 OrfB family transposase|uniref:Transposase, IS605 OrfB family, central region n=1 Tax=Lampropedia hyalina DSM 16112 TaxID=1122156 RepID=A0A1M5EMM5_9BURK|nr:RNA-guided endonuclease TnpB family protein [Lampropedia hyalina]SHF80455.1 transposase, IS605 OrfB family, central region [Lampropedia hyalina DSM 16112]